MTVAEISETKFSVMHLIPMLIKSQVAAQNDWTVIDGVKGVIPMGYGVSQSTSASATETLTYGTFHINGSGQNTTTNTSFICANGTTSRTTTPYYVLTASGEIMEVISETDATNATTTITVVRGCLGTTASATGLADTNHIGIMNIIIHALDSVGPHINIVYPLPNDRRVKMFA
jgi:hypothetical protein